MNKLKISLTFKISAIYALLLSAFLVLVWLMIAAALAISGYLDKYSDFFGIMIGMLLFLFAFVVFISVLIGSFTTKKMLSPIQRMINSVKSSTSSALYTRLDVVKSYDELKVLAETFNEMLDMIQASYEQQSRFVSDASHELRTPIFVIQSYANLLKRWGKDDPQTLEDSIDEIISETENMKNLVEKLLYLARADNNTLKFEKTVICLNELIDDTIKDAKLLDADHEYMCKSNEEILINGDKGLIRQALRIFLDNSMKYTEKGGMIEVSSYRKDTFAYLVVEDNGIGISNEDLPYIFDRFYKCDKSRSLDRNGTGLGLTIAKWIIEKHEGSISVESVKGKGTKILVKLPVY